MFDFIRYLYEDTSGQGLMEYGLIVSIISVSVILLMAGIGDSNNNTMTVIANEMPN
jgi:Flp pilus assembly pilin Flp